MANKNHYVTGKFYGVINETCLNCDNCKMAVHVNKDAETGDDYIVFYPDCKTPFLMCRQEKFGKF